MQFRAGGLHLATCRRHTRQVSHTFRCLAKYHWANKMTCVLCIAYKFKKKEFIRNHNIYVYVYIYNSVCSCPFFGREMGKAFRLTSKQRNK